MKRDLGGVIWTDHALQRLKQRGISQGDAWATFNSPDQSRQGSNKKGSWVYYKTYGNQRIEVVAKKNDQGQWIILSVWSKPICDQGGRRHSHTKRRKKKDNPVMWFIKWIFNKHEK